MEIQWISASLPLLTSLVSVLVSPPEVLDLENRVDVAILVSFLRILDRAL